MTELELVISNRFNKLEIIFDEKTRRMWAAAEALSVGRGGVSAVNRVTGISRSTIHQGIKELEDTKSLGHATGRTRASGGGRKKIVDSDPELRADLDALFEPVTRGDPESALRWTCKYAWGLPPS